MKRFSYIITALSLMAAACSQNEDMPKEPEPIICPTYSWKEALPLNQVAPLNIERSNGFATSLFKTIYAKEQGNLCISPASAFCTLAMMANGDEGECRDELLDILGYDDGPDALHQLNLYSNALLAEVTDFNGDTQCGFTNSLWHRPDFELLPSFANDLAEIFAATEFPIWLGDEAGRSAINEFVERNTRGMIKDFLKEPIDLDLAILNTTYFKGTWKQKFEKKLTKKDYFHNADGSVSKAPFMTLTDNMAYTHRDGVIAVRLPYAGDRYMMTLIQPEKPEAFDDMITSLDSKRIEDISSWLYTHMVELRLPKYETELNLDIIDCLTKMGLNKTCRPGILKAAVAGPIELVMFRHAVKITVDEEGTEGGAASMAGFLYTSTTPDPIPEEPISVNFDNPFIYLIRDTISGTVLFMGAVTDF